MMSRCCRGRSLSDPPRKIWFSKTRLEGKINWEKPETEKMKKVKLEGEAKTTKLREFNLRCKGLNKYSVFFLILEVKNGDFASLVL